MSRKAWRLRRRELLRALAGAAALPAWGAGSAMAEPAMITRPIPSSGEAMPVIGLGTWPVFDVGASEEARRPLREVVQRLVDGGGRMIDTSPMYGKSEGVVGDIVAELGYRDKTFLATKVWISGRDQGIAQMARSASLLKSPVIDLMQIHNLVDWRTQLATMRDMKAKGQLRYIGITHYTTGALPELARILDSEDGIDFVQCGYSLATREPETRLLPVCATRGIAVIVNQPFEQGDLFRQVRGKPLPDWAADFDCASWAQLFLKYLLGDPAVTVLIPATNKPAHMEDNLRAGFGRLPDARQREQIRRWWDLVVVTMSSRRHGFAGTVIGEAMADTAANSASTSALPMPRVMNTRRERRSSSGQASSSTGRCAVCCTAWTTTGPFAPATATMPLTRSRSRPRNAVSTAIACSKTGQASGWSKKIAKLSMPWLWACAWSCSGMRAGRSSRSSSR